MSFCNFSQKNVEAALQNEKKQFTSENIAMLNVTSTEFITLDTNRQKWLKDSTGCLYLRSLELADQLIKNYDLFHKSKSEFILVFGKPNDINNTQDKLYLIYYIKSVCYEGMLIENADKSWIDFIIINDTLREYGYFVE